MSIERCPHCGSEGTAGAPCPQCLMELGIEDDEAREPGSDTTQRDDSPQDRPERIGHYRIVDVLGEGGMGVVYLAEQEEPVRRQVALKTIQKSLKRRHDVLPS